ncbi:hypothetical protein F4820DRAFT_36600 [Hypoxylon rubiginosum]|uniref:Uncharacterized protein n=1 Tax=Hypoxylon rubiginosum TaxID=110542 RepID=A0ACB9YRT4_9PEZI|nr:hypothetical protein F4820DRAFT_36600 [Hypoxylon rubiginosum]
MGDGQQYYMRAENVIAAAIALSILDIVAVALRFWTRKVQRNPPRADDWLMIPATLVTVGIGIDQLYGVSQRGLGYWTEIPPGYTGSKSDLVTPQLIAKSQVEWAYTLMLPVALGCMKASFLFFYMRVFAIQKQSAIYKTLVGFITVVVLWAVTFVFATLFECGRDFRSIWGSQSEFQKQCTNTKNFVLILCITDFVSDILIIAIPVPLVLRLNLSTSKKIGVCSMFLLGGGTVVASLIRFIMMVGSFIGNFDITSDNILGVTACMYWGMVECGVGVFAACLPTIQVLFRRWIWEPAVSSTKSMFSSRSSRSSRYSGAYKEVIHVEKNFNIAYAKINDDSSRTEYPALLPPIHKTYDMWDERVGAAV